jgi:hypothetical protein
MLRVTKLNHRLLVDPEFYPGKARRERKAALREGARLEESFGVEGDIPVLGDVDGF